MFIKLMYTGEGDATHSSLPFTLVLVETPCVCRPHTGLEIVHVTS